MNMSTFTSMTVLNLARLLMHKYYHPDPVHQQLLVIPILLVHQDAARLGNSRRCSCLDCWKCCGGGSIFICPVIMTNGLQDGLLLLALVTDTEIHQKRWPTVSSVVITSHLIASGRIAILLHYGHMQSQASISLQW